MKKLLDGMTKSFTDVIKYKKVSETLPPIVTAVESVKLN